MLAAKARAKFRRFGNGRQIGFFCADAARAGFRYVDPCVAVAFLAWEGRAVDARGIERVLAGERGDFLALARYWFEGPAMVFAGECCAVETSAGKRNAAMGAT